MDFDSQYKPTTPKNVSSRKSVSFTQKSQIPEPTHESANAKINLTQSNKIHADQVLKDVHLDANKKIGNPVLEELPKHPIFHEDYKEDKILVGNLDPDNSSDSHSKIDATTKTTITPSKNSFREDLINANTHPEEPIQYAEDNSIQTNKSPLKSITKVLLTLGPILLIGSLVFAYFSINNNNREETPQIYDANTCKDSCRIGQSQWIADCMTHDSRSTCEGWYQGDCGGCDYSGEQHGGGTCTPNESRCDGNDRLQCNNDGVGWKKINNPWCDGDGNIYKCEDGERKLKESCSNGCHGSDPVCNGSGGGGGGEDDNNDGTCGTPDTSYVDGNPMSGYSGNCSDYTAIGESTCWSHSGNGCAWLNNACVCNDGSNDPSGASGECRGGSLCNTGDVAFDVSVASCSEESESKNQCRQDANKGVGCSSNTISLAPGECTPSSNGIACGIWQVDAHGIGLVCSDTGCNWNDDQCEPKEYACVELDANINNTIVSPGARITFTCTADKDDSRWADFRVQLDNNTIDQQSRVVLNNQIATWVHTVGEDVGNYTAQCRICAENTQCTDWGVAEVKSY